MSRRRKGRDVHGVVLLDKPAGYSSNQAVQKVRWLFGARKAGHTGSLDPFATGMLPICLGEASKTAAFMLDASKTYVARALLGQATTTGDVEGEVSETAPLPELTGEEVERVLTRFRGTIEQTPPMYSALKHEGQPLYRLARAGREVPRQPREVTIHELELLEWKPPLLEFRARCSKGTYMRTLAEDIARAMGSCAHLRALRRLEVEPFEEAGMITLEALEGLARDGALERCLLPPDAGLRDWPVVTLDENQALRFGHGNPVPATGAPAAGLVRVYGPGARLLGLGELTPGRVLEARRIMQLQGGEAHK
ncbi:MAG TPA: tRNA pseudouridine(55) synthase TruB [Xanthomonadales bacterium]|nr:tRNA pseudouridine(55) synthase TruB [Xanthomonadales bacterium]